MTVPISPDQRQRARLFDIITTKTAAALELAQQYRMGPTGSTIADAVHDAFLPNVEDGRVTMPEKYRRTSKIAFLPLLPGEDIRDMDVDLALYQPTPRRLKNTAWLLHCSTREVVANMPRLAPTTYTPATNNSITLTQFSKVTHKDLSAVVAARPLVVLSALGRTELTAINDATHEFRHGVDYETCDIPPQIFDGQVPYQRFRAGLELRAYYPARAVLAVMGVRGEREEAVGAIWEEFDLGATDGWGVNDDVLKRVEPMGFYHQTAA